MADPAKEAFRRTVLAGCGASGEVLGELLAYGANAFEGHPGLDGGGLPMGDEPQLAAWEEYERDARRDGAFPALQRRFGQLRFPIQAGISQDPAYRRATLRGSVPWEAPGLALRDPGGLALLLNPTPAGRVPILQVADRADFVTLVQAFTCRNEPERIPDSMGACIVNGLNNWDRIARHRQEWEGKQPAAPSEEDWNAEFQRLVPRKELYQDRFIILSSGPYSALPAQAAGFPEQEWRALSIAIRREHECTHYFTYRVLGAMRNNAHDELMADLAGLARCFGRYDGSLALRFLGLEDHPRYREGGRLESYLGTPRLSEPAFAALRTLVVRAVRNLEAFLAARPALLADAGGVARVVLCVAALTLEELSSEEMAARLEARLERVAAAAAANPRRRPQRRMSVRAPGTAAGLARILKMFARFAERQPAITPAYGDVSVVLDELISNTVKYGYGSDPHGSVSVTAAVRRGLLEVVVIDDAHAFDPLAAPEPRTDQTLEERPIGGLGIHIVKKLMDEVEYARLEGGFNQLVLRKRLGE